MRYLRVAWRHDFADEPTDLFSELNQASREIRKVERFRDGSSGWADGDSSGGPTRLGIEPVPPLDEINADPEFDGREIDRAEFEAAWRLARADSQANPSPTILSSSPSR